MRPSLTILLILFSVAVFSQKYTPVGVANSYTLTEADGFPGSNYVSGFEYAPTGEIYAKDFFGNFHITGNNFAKHVAGLENITNNTNLKMAQGGEVWLIDEACNISVIRNDSLREVIKYPGENGIAVFPTLQGSGTLTVMEYRNGTIQVRQFSDHNWKMTNEFPFAPNGEYKYINGYLLPDGRLAVATALPSGEHEIYETDSLYSKLNYIATLSPEAFDKFQFGFNNGNWKNSEPLIKRLVDFAVKRLRPDVSVTVNNFKAYFIGLFPSTALIFRFGNNLYEYLTVDKTQINPNTVLFESKDKLNGVRINPGYPYITILTGNKPFRVFPYIKKYPRIYELDNSNNIFALAQDDSGRIWAGNYQNELSIIDDPLSYNKAPSIIRLKKQLYPFMNASLTYDGKIYLVGEFGEGGISRYDMNGKMTKLLPQVPTAYYLYLAPRSQTIYYPTAAPGYPVYYCKAEELEKPYVHWNKLDSTAGIAPFGMTSITEDTLGRIWMGHPKKGFAVYDPATGKGISYKTHDNETPIGFVSSITDKWGTVCMGSDNLGLWCYDDYHKTPAPKNIHKVSHPLLNKIPRITSMAIYDDWLVMGCYDKICLLNLDSFYQKKKVILRYLNPQESNFTSFTEQNTMLVSKKDSSFWFSTSDMLYRWDIKTWLHLPVYKVKVNTYLQYDSNQIEMKPEKSLKLSPHVRGFDIFFEYLSPDGLPRYTRAALVRQGDSIAFNEPGMVSRSSYKSLNSGSYTFQLEILEQDGNISKYHYSFEINRYIWQHWWFWTLATLLFLLPFALWLNTLRKKAMQQRKISQMNLVTLSSQFRPHFILNALNAIGADLKDNPGAERIISRLGESINLIFNYAQLRKVSHSLEDEWALLQNVIEIHRIIYLPELNFTFHNQQLLEKYKGMELPLGILEIHVENALLHGLRNKRTPPYNLKIEINDDDAHLYFTITDDGIGRREAMGISSYKRNGVGTKNLDSIISILNRYNKNKINIIYTDLLEVSNHGTMVKVILPKKYYFKY